MKYERNNLSVTWSVLYCTDIQSLGRLVWLGGRARLSGLALQVLGDISGQLPHLLIPAEQVFVNIPQLHHLLILPRVMLRVFQAFALRQIDHRWRKIF